MAHFVDLHCHYIPRIDDEARSIEESAEILNGLQRLGFGTVYATPHMRPGMFDNDAAALRAAFAAMQAAHRRHPVSPSIALSAEHYFDDVVFGRIQTGQALPYPGNRAILLEFYESDFPFSLDQRLADISRRGMTPVVAHPERYRPIAKDPEVLERLLDIGAKALLDLAALVGKYGRNAQKTAEALLERGLYAAACSDAHHTEDIAAVSKGIDWVAKHYGDEELVALLVDGPAQLIRGGI